MNGILETRISNSFVNKYLRLHIPSLIFVQKYIHTYIHILPTNSRAIKYPKYPFLLPKGKPRQPRFTETSERALFARFPARGMIYTPYGFVSGGHPPTVIVAALAIHRRIRGRRLRVYQPVYYT